MPIHKSIGEGYLGTNRIREGIFDMYEQSSLEGIPKFVGTSSNNILLNVTSIDFEVPFGTQNGDFAVAMLTGGGGANDVDDWANSQGFTFLYENKNANRANSAIAYKLLDGTEGANFTFTTTSACKLSGEVVVYRGSESIISSSENNSTTNTVTRVANSVDTPIKNTILFAFFAVSGDNAIFLNPPSDLTLLRTFSDSRKHNYWIGYKTVTNKGPTGDVSIDTDDPPAGSGKNFLFTI